MCFFDTTDFSMNKAKQKIKKNVQVELEFMESLAHRMPEDVDILKVLSDLYTKVGRCNEGLRIDLKLSSICVGEPNVWYNLACSYALVNEADHAFVSLSRAVDLGYRDFVWMGQDEDLASIRSDIRFLTLLKRMCKTL